jgi:hypothetical protein
MILDLVTLILGLQRYTFNNKIKILFEIFLVRKSEKSGSQEEAVFRAKKSGNSITVSRLPAFSFLSALTLGVPDFTP